MMARQQLLTSQDDIPRHIMFTKEAMFLFSEHVNPMTTLARLTTLAFREFNCCGLARWKAVP